MISIRRLGPSVAAAVALAGVLVFVSCGKTSVGEGNGGQEDAGVFDPNTLEAGIDPGNGNAVCHEQTFVPEKVGDPDILILMDMSGSMSESGKYSQTATAINNVVGQLEDDGAPIYWGLIFFPGDGGCGVAGMPEVEPGPDNADAIATAINSKSPAGNTPAHKAVELGVGYYSSLADERAHYLLIATDGQPNCEDDVTLPRTCQDDTHCEADEVCQIIPFFGGICVSADGSSYATDAIAAALAAGIKTYVVGIDIDGTNVTLDRMAEEGGTARSGSPKYFPVSDQASLEETLQNIATEIISCTFALDVPPLDMDYVSVTVSNHGVERDETHTNGWDIDTDSLTMTLYGAACDELQTNPDTISVIFGCPPVS